MRIGRISSALAIPILAAACGAGVAPATPAPRRAAVRPDVPDTAECSTLSRLHCMAAAHCTLVEATVAPPGSPDFRSGKYVCRPAANACESGFAQWDLPGGGATHFTDASAQAAIASCTGRPGCSYVPADCYCTCRGYGATSVPDGPDADACSCFCAGGRPPACALGPAATSPGIGTSSGSRSGP